jgi:hypothetical protein
MKTKKIILTELKQLVKNIIKEEKEKLNELDTNTYANLMNNTEKYPWSQFLSGTQSLKGDEKKRSVPHKEERVNNLARLRFTKKFYEEFPLNDKSTNIITNDGEYYFKGIRFNTNYTYYSLSFERNDEFPMPHHLYIMPERNGYYIYTNGIKITDDDSDKLINNMLKYNLMKKK